MRLFTVSSELKVGSVVEVAGDAIRIEIDAEVSELTRTHGGNVYPVGQCGSVLKLHSGRKILFAYVRVLRMRSEIAFEEGAPIPPAAEDARMIEATLFAEGRWSEARERLALERGVATYPLPGQAAYLTTLDELSALYGPNNSTSNCKHQIRFGSYVSANESHCYADLDKLIGLHCAVLGSTGAGKSAAVAAILKSILQKQVSKAGDSSEVSRLRPRIVLIDPHGEYARALSDRCVVFGAYSAAPADPSEEPGVRLRLPYWLMSGEEFRDLVIGKTEWEATSENSNRSRQDGHGQSFPREFDSLWLRSIKRQTSGAPKMTGRPLRNGVRRTPRQGGSDLRLPLTGELLPTTHLPGPATAAAAFRYTKSAVSCRM